MMTGRYIFYEAIVTVFMTVKIIAEKSLSI